MAAKQEAAGKSSRKSPGGKTPGAKSPGRKTAEDKADKAPDRAASAGARPSDGGSADYGLDSPSQIKSMYSRGAWTFAFGFALWFMNRQEYPGPAASLLVSLSLVAAVFVWAGYFMMWSSRTGKLVLRDRLVAMLALSGDEKVLDAGCGRGLLSIGVAKRMKTGKVTAVDLWNPQALSGNSAEAARANAKAEGVADRVRFEDGDVCKLAYPAENFDVAISGSALHFFDDEPDRDQAVRELYRVVKPGGKLLIFDISYVGRYAQILRECGASDVNVTSAGFLWCRLTKSVTARK
jgi:SAM-dependent methyltransferase